MAILSPLPCKWVFYIFFVGGNKTLAARGLSRYSDDAAAALIPDVLSVMHAMERVLRTSHDRIRYTPDRLMEFRDACTQLPEEVANSGIEVLTASDEVLRMRERNGQMLKKNERIDTHDRSNSSAQALPAPVIAKAADLRMDRGGAYSEKVYRTVKDILNKLTPEKFDVVADEMIHAGIRSVEIMQGVISLIFDKAMLEPVLCAKLCVQLSKELPEFPSEQVGDKPVTFRRVLLNTCQKVFKSSDAMREEIKKLTNSMERDEMEKRMKLRTLGNVILIGELFKQRMLPEKTVHRFIPELLGQDPKATPAEENVEAVCHLLTTAGKQLEESKKSRRAIDTYFARLKVIGKSTALTSPIRYMVRDIVDMRSNKWVPRGEEMKAKTIDEILAKAEAKLALRNGRAAAMPGLLPGLMMPGMSGKLMPGMPGMPGTPAGGIPGSPMMGNFTSAGMKADVRETEAVRTVERREDSTGLLPMPRSGGFGLMGGAMAGGDGRMRFDSPAMHAGGMSARARPQGSACYGFMSSGSPKPVAPADLTKKSESLVKEYLSIVDLNEAVLCVQELKSPGFHAELVRVAMVTALDMREKECSLVLKLLLHLHAKGVISTSDLKGGVLLVTEGLEDMAMDAPLAPKGLGGMLAGLVLAGAVELQLMQEAALKLEDEFLQKAVIKAFVEKLKENEAEVGEVCGKASVDKEGLLSVAVASDLSKLLTLGGCRAAFIARDNFGNKDDFNLRGLLHRVQMFGT